MAAAEFKVPEPKTRGQKRKSEDAQEHREQWWLRGVTETDDEPQETHTGDSPRAMSTRSSTASAWNAEEIVEDEKLSWPEEDQDQLHSAGMGAGVLSMHGALGWETVFDMQDQLHSARMGATRHVTAPSRV